MGDAAGVLASGNPRTTVREDSVVVGGVRCPYIEAGPSESSEAVVFVHGIPGCSKDWQALTAQVGAFGRAVALDMPGFGRADKPRNFPYTVGGYARHLADVLRTLGIRRAHFVLHDFAGPFGLTCAVAHSEAFASVVLINTGILLGFRWHYLARICRVPILGEIFMATITRPSFHVLIKRGNPLGLPRNFIDKMYDDFDWGTRRAVLRFYRAMNPARLTQRSVAALRHLDRPALVVWGKHDLYIPVAFAERQREAFPHAQVVILEKSGHWPFADDPARVAGVILPFLRLTLGV